MDKQAEQRNARIFGLIAAGLLAGACLLVLRPFVSSLLWAVILVYCTWPAYRFLMDKLRLGRGSAALVMVLAEFALIVVPILLAAPRKREDMDDLRGMIERGITAGPPEVGRLLEKLPMVGGYLGNWWNAVAFDMTGVLEVVQPYAGTIAQAALSVILALLSGLVEVMVAILLAFFFYRDGPALAVYARNMMRRLAGERGDELFWLTANVTTGVVYGLLGTAVAQGFATGIGLWIAGVPRPILLGIVAGAMSILPVGAAVVWVPAAIWLFASGETGWGLFLTLYGVVGISSVDNVIRPWLISRGADLPLLLTILGALGGVFAFGFLGLFLGPVLLALGYALLKDWASKAEKRAV